MGSQGGKAITSPDSYTCTSSLGARGFGTTTWKTYLKDEFSQHKGTRGNGRCSLLEPSIRHDIKPILSSMLTPRILDFIPNRLPSDHINMNASDYHGMRHRRLAHLESLCLSQFEFYIESTLRRSEEHTSELQSHSDLVCRLLLEKK